VSARRPILCLTPARNEAWILPVFLRAASTWADRIFITDQQSTDATRAVCREFPKVEVIENSGAGYDEANYRRLPLEVARAKFPGAIIVAIDADEVFSGDAVRWLASDAPQNAPPGSAWSFPWLNLKAGRRESWTLLRLPVVLVDDGSEFSGKLIHSPRIPRADAAQPVPHPGACLFHLQYLNAARLASKQRWYQALERVKDPRKSAVWIYRAYHHLALLLPEQFQPVNPAAFQGSGITEDDLAALERANEPFYWWDAEVLRWMAERGPECFRRLDLWDTDWNALIARGCPGWRGGHLEDPRGSFDRGLLNYLARSQPRSDRWRQRKIDKALRALV
jgi:hypothetical protein